MMQRAQIRHHMFLKCVCISQTTCRPSRPATNLSFGSSNPSGKPVQPPSIPLPLSNPTCLAADKNKLAQAVPSTFPRNHCTCQKPQISFAYASNRHVFDVESVQETRPTPSHKVSRNSAQWPSSIPRSSTEVDEYASEKSW